MTITHHSAHKQPFARPNADPATDLKRHHGHLGLEALRAGDQTRVEEIIRLLRERGLRHV